MKKKNNKKKELYSFISLCFVAISLFGANKVIQHLHKKDTTIVAEQIQSHTNCTLDTTNYIQDLENQALKELEKLNISKDKLDQAIVEYNEEFLKAVEINNMDPASTETITLVQEVLDEFNIDKETIKIVQFNNPAPAASCHGAIFINESRFNAHSKPAQYFMIGHEIQHLLYKDSLKDFVISKLLKDCTLPEKESILSRYSKIVEQLADNRIALRSPLWAERYLAFAQESMGDQQVKTIHPQSSERLKIAQTLLEHSKQQIV